MKRIVTALTKLKEDNRYRKIPNIMNKSSNYVSIEGKNYINFASNDYLSISTDKILHNEFYKQCDYSLSSASARLLSGTSSEFINLEDTLAKLFNKEACLIFNTGYQCNLGVISSLCEKGDIVFSDKLNHASIIDGMKLADGEFIRFKHLDYNHLESLLKTKRNKYNRAIIVSESIFSMDGDIANIKKLVELKNKYNCILMLDEAHAFCAYGKGITGLCEQDDVDIITATFGKALGSFGAFCVANNDIIAYLTNKARSFIFSTSIPPINIAWSNWLLTEKMQILLNQKTKLNTIINECHNILSKYNISTPDKTHIIPILIGSSENANKISEILKSNGYYVPAIRPPTVPEGSARLRISLTANTDITCFKKLIELILESMP